MRPKISHRTLLLLPLAAVLATTTSARSCPGEEVHVTVVSVLATDKDDKVDKKLVDLAKKIKQKKPNLTGFKIDTQPGSRQY